MKLHISVTEMGKVISVFQDRSSCQLRRYATTVDVDRAAANNFLQVGLICSKGLLALVSAVDSDVELL